MGTPDGNSCASNTQNSGNLNTDKSVFNSPEGNHQYVLWQGIQTTSPLSSTNWSTSQLNTKFQSTTGKASTIKGNVKTWYNTNIAERDYESRLEDMNLCFEFKGNTSNTATTFDNIEVNGTGTQYYFSQYARSISHPSYNCSDGVTITSKYGLISVDEASYGGVVRYDKTYSNTAWMVDTRNYYWTLSPAYVDSSGVAYVSTVNILGNQGNSNVHCNIGVRPLISLSSKVSVKSGDGTIETPFIIN